MRTLRSAVRTHREVALENLALRQQLAVWKAREPRPRLTALDRIFWVVLSRFWKSPGQVWTGWQQALVIVSPATVLRWQRRRFREYWTQEEGIPAARRGRMDGDEPGDVFGYSGLGITG